MFMAGLSRGRVCAEWGGIHSVLGIYRWVFVGMYSAGIYRGYSQVFTGIHRYSQVFTYIST